MATGHKKTNLNRHPEVIKLKKRQTEELNGYLARNRFFAFNDQKKFNEGMRMLGLNPEDTDKVVDVGGGAMRADKIPELRALIKRHETELKELKRRLKTKSGQTE
ncbi:MAG: hypothetical protein RBR71_11365 [Gudongella sp.]|nr:hypothetical protein [Gudongella sp.]